VVEKPWQGFPDVALGALKVAEWSSDLRRRYWCDTKFLSQLTLMGYCQFDSSQLSSGTYLGDVNLLHLQWTMMAQFYHHRRCRARVVRLTGLDR